MSNLDSFRLETRDWLEDNCPETMRKPMKTADDGCWGGRNFTFKSEDQKLWMDRMGEKGWTCLLYTSPSPRDATLSRMPSSA